MVVVEVSSLVFKYWGLGFGKKRKGRMRDGEVSDQRERSVFVRPLFLLLLFFNKTKKINLPLISVAIDLRHHTKIRQEQQLLLAITW